MSERKFRPFEESELKVIKENSGKITLMELSKKLEMNYCNLSTALKQHQVPFIPAKAIRKSVVKESSSMNRKFNDEGLEILTDEMMEEWFK